MTVHQFAERAGVTVKALYYYDRIGLLKPARSESGYRIYTDRDLERLEQIAALRFLGVPLKKIAAVVDGFPSDFRETLNLQREALEEKRRKTEAAIAAIDAAERAEGAEVANRLIIAVQALHVDISKYFNSESLAALRAFHEMAKTADWMTEWRELQNDVLAAADQDPAGETGQALGSRFQEFIARNGGAFPAFAPLPDAPKIPSALAERFRQSNVGKVVPFLMKAIAAGKLA